jgi:O-antigen ligase
VTAGAFLPPAWWSPAAREGAEPPATDVNPVVRVAFYLFIATIPFEIPHRAIPLELPTLVGFVFLGATALNPSACYRRIPPAVMWFFAYLWAFCATVLLQLLDHRGLAFRLFVNMTELVLILWAGGNLLADRRVWRGAVSVFVTACTARAAIQLLGVGATASTVWTGGTRVTALGQNANLSAMILSVALAAAVGLGLGRDPALPRRRLLAWPIAGLLGAAIIQTGSRGGLLGAGLGLLVFLLVRAPTVAQAARNLTLAIVAVALLGWGAAHSLVMRNRITEAAEQHALAGRERIYPVLLEMFSERPLLGWGPIDNQFELALRLGERATDRRDAHNLVLELLTTTGVFGATPFLIGLALCVRSAWRARHGPRGALPLAMLAAALTGTISGTWIAAKIVWLALAGAVAAGHTAALGNPAAGRMAPCAA